MDVQMSWGELFQAVSAMKHGSECPVSREKAKGRIAKQPNHRN